MSQQRKDIWHPPDLNGKVAVVTGASRSAGRGIAMVLGECGATVYVTGRSVPGRPSPARRDEQLNIAETARLVTERGGTGIPVEVDHANDAEVEVLFCKVGKEYGRLDLLVNNAWDGYSVDYSTFDEPFWAQPMLRFERMWTIGLRSNLVATRMAVPLLRAADSGLVVNTTLLHDVEIDALVGNGAPKLDPAPGQENRGSAVFYVTTKLAINVSTVQLAKDFRWSGHDVSVVGLSSGWLRTEAQLAECDTDEEHWHTIPELAPTESTQLIGRATATLAADPDVRRYSGETLLTRQVATEYGFTDLNGWPAVWFRHGDRNAALPGEASL